mgnify:CR=1 FL=1
MFFKCYVLKEKNEGPLSTSDPDPIFLLVESDFFFQGSDPDLIYFFQGSDPNVVNVYVDPKLWRTYTVI